MEELAVCAISHFVTVHFFDRTNRLSRCLISDRFRYYNNLQPFDFLKVSSFDYFFVCMHINLPFQIPWDRHTNLIVYFYFLKNVILKIDIHWRQLYIRYCLQNKKPNGGLTVWLLNFTQPCFIYFIVRKYNTWGRGV